jgi:hypothetical protein
VIIKEWSINPIIQSKPHLLVTPINRDIIVVLVDRISCIFSFQNDSKWTLSYGGGGHITRISVSWRERKTHAHSYWDRNFSLSIPTSGPNKTKISSAQLHEMVLQVIWFFRISYSYTAFTPLRYINEQASKYQHLIIQKTIVKLWNRALNSHQFHILQISFHR